MLEKPDASKPVFQVFPDALDRVKRGVCATCEKEIKEEDFRDELSKKEYSISGLCQGCQDEVL